MATKTGLDYSSQLKMFEEAMEKKRARVLQNQQISSSNKKMKIESDSEDEDLSTIMNPNNNPKDLSGASDDEYFNNGEIGEVRFEVALTTVNRLRITRLFLTRNLFDPRLRDMIRGFFVRVCLGLHPTTKKNKYKLCLIEDVVRYDRVYKVENIENQSALRVSFAGETKDFPIDIISNSRVEDDEFTRWKDAMRDKKLSIMSELEAENLLKRFNELNGRELTDTEIRQRREAMYEFVHNMPNLQKFIVQAEDDIKIAEQAQKFKTAERLKKKVTEAKELLQKRANDRITESTLQLRLIEENNRRRYYESIMNGTAPFSKNTRKNHYNEVCWDVSGNGIKIEVDTEALELEEKKRKEQQMKEREEQLRKKYSSPDPEVLNMIDLKIDKSALIEDPNGLKPLPVLPPLEGGGKVISLKEFMKGKK